MDYKIGISIINSNTDINSIITSILEAINYIKNNNNQTNTLPRTECFINYKVLK